MQDYAEVLIPAISYCIRARKVANRIDDCIF